MTIGEKLILFKWKGWTCNPESGEVWSHTGKLIVGKSAGYICCGININKKMIIVLGHQLVWFLSTGKVPKMIDHINGIKSDNRLINLRDVETHQKNNFNRINNKGYTFNKRVNKFQAQIHINYKLIYLGIFNTEEEARQAYLDAKKLYHII